MTGLSESKRRAMSALMDMAPEEVLEAIEMRFAHAGGRLAGDVVALARQERLARAVLQHAFGPVLGLMVDRRDGVAPARFPRTAAKKIWDEVARRRPDAAANLTGMIGREAQMIAPAGMADGLSAEAGAVIRSVEPSSLGLRSEAQADDLAAYFDMVPIARPAMEQLHDWLGKLDGEHLTTLRLAFKDADTIREDGRARLMEMLMTRLPRAAEVLRLIAGLTDQASADFIDGTEMASFPARLLDHVECLAAGIQLDGPNLTDAEAARSIADLILMSDIFHEFDVGFPGTVGGNWTRRLQAVRRRLTDQLETAFRAIPKIVDKALPLASSRLAGRMSRMAPDLSADAHSPVVLKARTSLCILSGTRTVASELGCEGARRAAADSVSERIDSYAEEALQMLHDGGVENPAKALELIEIAAEFLALSRNEAAGALVRRRAAVALATDVDRDDAAA